MWIVIGAIILLGCGTAYAAPKVKDYLAVNDAIGSAKQLQASGNYAAALAKLNNVDGMWMFSSTKQNLENLEKQEGGFVQDQNNYNLAISEKSSSTVNAQSLLQSIPTDYPQYGQVQTALNSVQSQIEGQLKTQAQQAQAQAASAQAAKASAQAAAAAAQSQATAAAQAAQEQAAASAAAAQQAQAAAAAQAAQAAQQRRAAIITQLTHIYASLSADNTSYYENAIVDSNDGEELTAEALFDAGIAVFDTAESDANSILNDYTNLDPDISAAASDAVSAATYCIDASNSGIQVAEGYGDASVTNSDHDSCVNSMAQLEAFLNAN
jgi:hypothetical protein